MSIIFADNLGYLSSKAKVAMSGHGGNNHPSI